MGNSSSSQRDSPQVSDLKIDNPEPEPKPLPWQAPKAYKFKRGYEDREFDHFFAGGKGSAEVQQVLYLNYYIPVQRWKYIDPRIIATIQREIHKSPASMLDRMFSPVVFPWIQEQA